MTALPRPGDSPETFLDSSREFPFTAEDFRHIADMLRDQTGIVMAEVKAPLIYSRLVKRVRELGLQDFHSYCAILSDAGGGDERRRMMGALTTNVTRFFREPHHFEHLKTKVLPGLAEEAQSGGRIRLWSAGCSSGEEPYSVAMTLLSVMPDAGRYDVKILAVDIDPDVLAQGRAGLYSPGAIEALDPALRARWFTPATTANGDDAWLADAALRELVTFRPLNLLSDWPMRGAFQAIFCRNTVIYFDQGDQRRVWADMARVCAPGGTLYVGHSERISGTDRFRLEAPTTYRCLETR